MAPRERAAHCLECPACHTPGSLRVVRTLAINAGIRRRRICEVCHERFTSYEVLEPYIAVRVCVNSANV